MASMAATFQRLATRIPGSVATSGACSCKNLRAKPAAFWRPTVLASQTSSSANAFFSKTVVLKQGLSSGQFGKALLGRGLVKLETAESKHIRHATMSADAGAQVLENNPLLADAPFPLFDQVEAKDVVPAIRSLLKDLVSWSNTPFGDFLSSNQSTTICEELLLATMMKKDSVFLSRKSTDCDWRAKAVDQSF